ncbi:MAG: efflux RND transporter permease subunit, partial [Planctomycetota bacterium]
MIDAVIRFCLDNKLIVALIVIAVIGWGAMVAPFDWDLGGLPRSPVPTDAIPDIGENQQIVFTEWMGRSPQDVEDQITYPLTVALLGVPEVKTIRSYSFFGFSTIYVIFNEKADFYWSRTRVLEKLNSLPAGTLPEGVTPTLGPDATALGQVFWYTLEGRDPDGRPIGGWDLDELRTIQDWYVRYYIQSAEGISEVASVGGFVKEYQIDVDPDAMRAARVTLPDIVRAVQRSNIDVGARSIEINRVEYFVRGLGFIKRLQDIEQVVVAERDNVPIRVKDIAKVTLGPGLRRGALDKGGAEAVGGVVVVRYGFNPLQAIKNVKREIERFAPGLPTKVVIDYGQVTRAQLEQYARDNGFSAFDGTDLNHREWVRHLRAMPRERWPRWANTSQVTVVPFYDRTGLIYETLDTLNRALVEEILVTVVVILVSVFHLRSSLLISALLPLAVLMCFIAMRSFHVDANIVALSGIAIAIGTMVDMGIVLCENILKHLDEAGENADRKDVVFRAASEVGGAVLTAVSTTIVSFLPVFTMVGPEGKLFKPLAFTKTFALAASVIVALTIIPPAAHVLFTTEVRSRRWRMVLYALLLAAGWPVAMWTQWWAGAILSALGAYKLVEELAGAAGAEAWSRRLHRAGLWVANAAAVIAVTVWLTEDWLPLGPEHGLGRNLVFVAALIGGLLLFFQVFQHWLYRPLLRWALDHKLAFLSIPALVTLAGFTAWLGPEVVFGRIPQEYDQQQLSAEQVAALSPVERFKYRLAGLRGQPWESIRRRPLKD